MIRRNVLAAAIAAIAIASVGVPLPAAAQSGDHYGVNGLAFSPVEGSPSPEARGRGRVEYDGGSEPRSRWYGSFRFSGLRPDASYSVVVRGRYGENGSPEAAEYTDLCSFTADGEGAGGCFAYFRGLMRLDVAQLRLGGTDGRRVLQATRGEGNIGAIVTVPERSGVRASRAVGNDADWVERSGPLPGSRR